MMRMETANAELLRLRAELRVSHADLDRTLAACKRAEEALHQTEAYLRLVTGNVPVAIGRCDGDGRFISANSRFAECYGVSVDAMIGKRMSDFMEPADWESIHPVIEGVLGGVRVEVDHVLTIPGI